MNFESDDDSDVENAIPLANQRLLALGQPREFITRLPIKELAVAMPHTHTFHHQTPQVQHHHLDSIPNDSESDTDVMWGEDMVRTCHESQQEPFRDPQSNHFRPLMIQSNDSTHLTNDMIDLTSHSEFVTQGEHNSLTSLTESSSCLTHGYSHESIFQTHDTEAYYRSGSNHRGQVPTNNHSNTPFPSAPIDLMRPYDSPYNSHHLTQSLQQQIACNDPTLLSDSSPPPPGLIFGHPTAPIQIPSQNIPKRLSLTQTIQALKHINADLSIELTVLPSDLPVPVSMTPSAYLNHQLTLNNYRCGGGHGVVNCPDEGRYDCWGLDLEKLEAETINIFRYHLFILCQQFEKYERCGDYGPGGLERSGSCHSSRDSSSIHRHPQPQHIQATDLTSSNKFASFLSSQPQHQTKQNEDFGIFSNQNDARKSDPRDEGTHVDDITCIELHLDILPQSLLPRNTEAVELHSTHHHNNNNNNTTSPQPSQVPTSSSPTTTTTTTTNLFALWVTYNTPFHCHKLTTLILINFLLNDPIIAPFIAQHYPICSRVIKTRQVLFTFSMHYINIENLFVLYPRLHDLFAWMTLFPPQPQFDAISSWKMSYHSLPQSSDDMGWKKVQDYARSSSNSHPNDCTNTLTSPTSKQPIVNDFNPHSLAQNGSMVTNNSHNCIFSTHTSLFQAIANPLLMLTRSDGTIFKDYNGYFPQFAISGPLRSPVSCRDTQANFTKNDRPFQTTNHPSNFQSDHYYGLIAALNNYLRPTYLSISPYTLHSSHFSSLKSLSTISDTQRPLIELGEISTPFAFKGYDAQHIARSSMPQPSCLRSHTTIQNSILRNFDVNQPLSSPLLLSRTNLFTGTILSLSPYLFFMSTLNSYNQMTLDNEEQSSERNSDRTMQAPQLDHPIHMALQFVTILVAPPPRLDHHHNDLLPHFLSPTPLSTTNPSTLNGSMGHSIITCVRSFVSSNDQLLLQKITNSTPQSFSIGSNVSIHGHITFLSTYLALARGMIVTSSSQSLSSSNSTFGHNSAARGTKCGLYGRKNSSLLSANPLHAQQNDLMILDYEIGFGPKCPKTTLNTLSLDQIDRILNEYLPKGSGMMGYMGYNCRNEGQNINNTIDPTQPCHFLPPQSLIRNHLLCDVITIEPIKTTLIPVVVEIGEFLMGYCNEDISMAPDTCHPVLTNDSIITSALSHNSNNHDISPNPSRFKRVVFSFYNSSCSNGVVRGMISKMMWKLTHPNETMPVILSIQPSLTLKDNSPLHQSLDPTPPTNSHLIPITAPIDILLRHRDIFTVTLSDCATARIELQPNHWLFSSPSRPLLSSSLLQTNTTRRDSTLTHSSSTPSSTHGTNNNHNTPHQQFSFHHFDPELFFEEPIPTSQASRINTSTHSHPQTSHDRSNEYQTRIQHQIDHLLEFQLDPALILSFFKLLVPFGGITNHLKAKLFYLISLVSHTRDPTLIHFDPQPQQPHLYHSSDNRFHAEGMFFNPQSKSQEDALFCSTPQQQASSHSIPNTAPPPLSLHSVWSSHSVPTSLPPSSTIDTPLLSTLGVPHHHSMFNPTPNRTTTPFYSTQPLSLLVYNSTHNPHISTLHTYSTSALSPWATSLPQFEAETNQTLSSNTKQLALEEIKRSLTNGRPVSSLQSHPDTFSLSLGIHNDSYFHAIITDILRYVINMRQMSFNLALSSFPLEGHDIFLLQFTKVFALAYWKQPKRQDKTRSDSHNQRLVRHQHYYGPQSQSNPQQHHFETPNQSQNTFINSYSGPHSRNASQSSTNINNMELYGSLLRPADNHSHHHHHHLPLQHFIGYIDDFTPRYSQLKAKRSTTTSNNSANNHSISSQSSPFDLVYLNSTPPPRLQSKLEPTIPLSHSDLGLIDHILNPCDPTLLHFPILNPTNSSPFPFQSSHYSPICDLTSHQRVISIPPIPDSFAFGLMLPSRWFVANTNVWSPYTSHPPQHQYLNDVQSSPLQSQQFLALNPNQLQSQSPLTTLYTTTFHPAYQLRLHIGRSYLPTMSHQVRIFLALYSIATSKHYHKLREQDFSSSSHYSTFDPIRSTPPMSSIHLNALLINLTACIAKLLLLPEGTIECGVLAVMVYNESLAASLFLDSPPRWTYHNPASRHSKVVPESYDSMLAGSYDGYGIDKGSVGGGGGSGVDEFSNFPSTPLNFVQLPDDILNIQRLDSISTERHNYWYKYSDYTQPNRSQSEQVGNLARNVDLFFRLVQRFIQENCSSSSSSTSGLSASSSFLPNNATSSSSHVPSRYPGSARHHSHQSSQAALLPGQPGYRARLNHDRTGNNTSQSSSPIRPFDTVGHQSVNFGQDFQHTNTQPIPNQRAHPQTSAQQWDTYTSKPPQNSSFYSNVSTPHQPQQHQTQRQNGNSWKK